MNILTEYLTQLQEQDISTLIKGKYKILNHLTFIEDIPSIKKKGLIPKKNYSKYGNLPILNAVYLYHISASDVIKNFKKTFPNRKIVNIKIDAVKLNSQLFIADEDFYRYPYKRKIPSEEKMRKDAIQCLKDRGTIAYKGVIPLKYFLEIK